jgi:hypothetical protein
MWWYCGYQALPGVRASQLARQFLRQHDAGTNNQQDLRGWFVFPTGTAGFVLLEADTPRALSAVLDPYSKLVEWRVEAVSELNYNQVLEEQRKLRQRTAIEDLSGGIDPEVIISQARG